MSWDWLSFGLLTGGYLMLSVYKTFQRYKATLNASRPVTNSKEVEKVPNTAVEKKKFALRKYIKQIINYCVTYNSSILIVGSLSESYFYSLTMIGNILSITMGYVYAVLIVHPFTYSLEKEIKTPFQYFEKRYRSRWIRAITAIIAMFYQFSFVTLFLWGCSLILCTLIPAIPFWVSILVLGLYSLIGSAAGGFAQATYINLAQFLIVVSVVITASILTIAKSKNSIEELWHFAYINKRTKFFELKTNMKVRFTLLNQLVSLPFSWCALHSLNLSNFIRYRSVDGKVKSKIMLLSNLPIMVIFYIVILMSGGFLVYLFFYGCDPFKASQILSKNQTGVYWILLILGEYAPSLTGILFASVLCYSMVQHSSGVALIGNTLFEEAVKPILTGVSFTERDSKRIKLLMTISLSLISIMYAFLFSRAKNTLLSLLFLFNNSTNAPLLGLFFLSVFNKWANAFGAITGFMINLILNYWFASGAILIIKEFPSNVALCNTNNALQNYVNFNFSNLSYYTPNPIRAANTSRIHDFYLKNHPGIHFIFSLPAIWYCIFSVVTTFVLGSFFSFAYSLVTTGTFDADAKFNEKRKNYLYYYKVFGNLEIFKGNQEKKITQRKATMPYRKLKNKRQLSKIIEEKMSFRARKSKRDNAQLLKKLNEDVLSE